MIEDLIQETFELRELEFYSNNYKFSYSSLTKLMWDPSVFYQIYILGIRPDYKEKFLLGGKLVHSLLLDSEEKFNSLYCISPEELPTGNNKLLVDNLLALFKINSLDYSKFSLEDCNGEVLTVLQQMNLHQSLSTDKQRIDKVINNTNIRYWDFLRKKTGKQLIDQALYNSCLLSSQLVRDNKKISNLMGLGESSSSDIEVYNELELETTTFSKYPFGLKGILDNLKIDHKYKIIYINDLKTTSKELRNFPDTIELYSYWLQASIYISLVTANYSDLVINQNYRIQFHFIVIDSTQKTYAFLVSQKTISEWLDRMFETLDKALYHYNNKDYELPYNFSVGNVVL